MRAWPASAVAVWAAARDAGRCAADDVLHTLHDYAQVHELDPGGDALALLATVSGNAHMCVRMPAAGDAQGLPPDRATDAAMTAGEVILIDDRAAGATGPTRPLALVPFGTAERCRWQSMRYDAEFAVDQLLSDGPLGEIEYELREATGDAATIIGALSGARAASPADLRDALAARVAHARIDLPPHDNPRIDRVLASSAQIDAIVSLTGAGALGDSGSQVASADDQLRRLSALSRRARSAAVNTLIVEYSR
ncbi:serine/threonine protein kinase [Gordonia neofelifaecis NRRL B-59395]|uniref:Serine/threonine protein kinase n=2 Tax=Gordonia TaxID=2053 RepID=F1YG31_9ACTN|nr:serine/threonine protein kinase [Gordonia neofelifaecis NRRL B-59395]